MLAFIPISELDIVYLGTYYVICCISSQKKKRNFLVVATMCSSICSSKIRILSNVKFMMYGMFEKTHMHFFFKIFCYRSAFDLQVQQCPSTYIYLLWPDHTVVGNSI